MLLENAKIDFAFTSFPTREAALQRLAEISKLLTET